MSTTTTRNELTLVNRLKEIGCNLPSPRVEPISQYVGSRLKRFEESIAELVRSAVDDSPNFRSKKLDEFLAAVISGLKERVNRQKTAIMGHREFRRLERNNKSVEELVFQKDGIGVKKRILNVSLDQMRTALADANGIPENAVFYGPLCRDEFHRPGGKPNKYIVLIEDVGPEDAELLRALIAIGREGHAPVLSDVKPHVICPQDPACDDQPADFSGLPRKAEDIGFEYRKPENVALRGVQESADATHLALGVGNVLGRAPYDPITNKAPRSEWFSDGNGPLMIPPQVLLAKSLAASITRYKTAVRLIGVHSGGRHDRPSVVVNGQVQTTEVVIDEIMDMALRKCGFFNFLPWKDRDFVVSFGAPSAYVPVSTGDTAKDNDAIVASQLQNVMLSCQFGQLLKARLREAIGQTLDEKAIKVILKKEFNLFVTPDVNNVDQETLARKPLAKVNVDVKMVSPGYFHAEAQLQPHTQMVGAKVILTPKAEVSPAKP